MINEDHGKHNNIMKKVLLIVTAMCYSLFSCNSFAQKPAIDDEPVSEIDLHSYLGTWYEIARFDHSFEKDMEYTQAHYSLAPNGKVRVVNSGYRYGKFKQATGKAIRPDARKAPGRLRVSFFWPFYSDYRILMVGPDYKYALVSSKGPDYLWILSRDPNLPDDVLHEIINEANIRGFDTTRLTWVVQPTEPPSELDLDF